MLFNVFENNCLIPFGGKISFDRFGPASDSTEGHSTIRVYIVLRIIQFRNVNLMNSYQTVLRENHQHGDPVPDTCRL